MSSAADDESIDISGKLLPEAPDPNLHPKKARGEWLTWEDKQEIRQVIFEQKMFGWTNKEAVKIACQRIKRPEGISDRKYDFIKAEEADRNNAVEWVTIQAKAGFLENYMRVVEQMEYVRQRIFRNFEYETSKPIEEQNPHIVSMLTRNIREQLLAIAALGVGSPILMQIKNMIDKGLANEFFNDNRFLKENRESPEDSGEDRYTTTSGTTDEFAA